MYEGAGSQPQWQRLKSESILNSQEDVMSVPPMHAP